MKKAFVCSFGAAIISLAFVVCVFPQANWMTENAAALNKKQLNEIALPGAHDAGTFAIEAAKTGRFKIGDGDGFSSPDNKQAKRFLSFGSFFSDWAKTQEHDTSEMLNDGIRYLDIRVCVDGRRVLITCHGLFGASVESILDDVKKFTDANPRELVLLGFNHFWDRQYQIEQGKKQGEIEGLTTEKWAELVNLIKTKLNGKLVNRKNFSPKSKFGELRESKDANQVIALFDTDEVPNDDLIWKRMEENTWVEGWNADEFKAGTLKVLEDAKNKEYADKFYAIRSSVTPDEGGKLISKGFLSAEYPKSVSDLANLTNPVALGWIKNEWAGKYPINLIWADFYNRADLVKLAKYLNGIKVDFKNTIIGTNTNWTRWDKSKETEK